LLCSDENKQLEIGAKLGRLYLELDKAELAVEICEHMMGLRAWRDLESSQAVSIEWVLADSLMHLDDLSDARLVLVS